MNIEQFIIYVCMYIIVTGLGKHGLIAGLIKTDFFPEKASTKFKYCLRKIGALYIALLSRYDSK